MVILALALGAYLLEASMYRDYLGPVMQLPEGQAAYARALGRIVWSIVAVVVPLLALVAIAAYLMARRSIAPLQVAAERERHFAADIAHELRTPLATIASVAQTARDDSDMDRQRAFDAIAAAALDAARLVGDLSLLARAESPAALARETIDLRDTVTRVVREYEQRGSTLGIELAADTVFVEADERRIAQLVRNLLENAFHHAGSTVRVAVRPEGPDATIVVDDDGPGVPGEIRDRVFERRVHARDGSGMGLGLSISRWIARAHGGDVVLEDRARFVTRIPRLIEHDIHLA